MKLQYKLIRKYPGLPSDWEIGMKVGIGDSAVCYSPCDLKYSDTKLQPSDVLNFPEFWERVPNLCVPIGTCFSRSHLKDLRTYKIQGIDEYDRVIVTWGHCGRTTYSIISVNKYFKSGEWQKNDIDKKYKVLSFSEENRSFTITSVLRLKDNITFVIGDKVKTKSNVSFFITSFTQKLVGNSYQFFFINEFDVLVDLDDVQKLRLNYKTYDGVNIYEGEKVFYFDKTTKQNCVEISEINNLKSGVLYFSSLEKLQEYLLNFQCLSVNEVTKVINEYNTTNSIYLVGITEKLLNLVKNK